MTDGTTSLSFEYDESGLRTKKTVGTDETRYVWNGDKLVAQLGSSASFFFHYDASGEMISYTYAPASGTEKEYFLIKNLQGDVERVVTSAGSIVAQYNYDAWGNVVYSAGTFKNTNPIRYRSYYFDTESGLYYLKSRYYDPQVGRFINADAIVDASSVSSGLNLFTYCLNNSVNKIDYSGFVTIALGLEGVLSFATRSSLGVQLVADDTGRCGLLYYDGAGCGGPAASVSGVLTITNASSIDDLLGWGKAIGGSCGGGVEYVGAKNWDGIAISYGVGLICPEIHAESTHTYIKEFNNETVVKYVYYLFREALEFFQDSLDDSQKELLRYFIDK